jgi:hypothetical protein
MLYVKLLMYISTEVEVLKFFPCDEKSFVKKMKFSMIGHWKL